MSRFLLICSCLLSLTVFPGWTCGPPIDLDPGFDLWCGNDLCAWTVESGDVARVATWHRADYGVELVGDPVVIYQTSEITSAEADCFEFELQADSDPGVALSISMDFLDDGSTEYSHPLPSENYKPVRYCMLTPSWYVKVRFTIVKEGFGRAVLAQIKISKCDECGGARLELNDRPMGATCEFDNQCAQARCISVLQWRPDMDGSQVRACSGCRNDIDCSGLEVCGLEAGLAGWLYQDCGPAGRHLLGDRCISADECAGGFCCQGICSQCCDGQGCPNQTDCKIRDWRTLGEDYEFQILPHQCSPGEGAMESSVVCLKDDDCISADCQGVGQLKQCFLDGRRCQLDEECPLWNACLPIGETGGQCQ
ncbi:MAG: hypothetical protein JRJ19_06385 [Deltaproteobacteria bacterium]|nr:hypothetical protein [Deltaproteobacteria bacterium]MBW1871672.1 hypothetical protein [Deltaproteobacteria bacterium]